MAVCPNGLNVDGFFLQYDDERSGGFERLRFVPKGRQAVLGVLVNRIAEGEHDISDEVGWMPESSDQALGMALGIQLRE
jgi:hypothetical protein